MCDLEALHYAGNDVFPFFFFLRMLKTREPVRSMASLILDRYFKVKNRKHFRMSFLTPGIDSQRHSAASRPAPVRTHNYASTDKH